jgi:proline dehydrogenase
VTSFNQLIVKVTEMMPKSVVGYFSRRYIAGESLSDGVDVVKNLNSNGIYATMDVLGESIKTKEEAIYAKNNALEVFEAITKFNLKSNLSIKPTQLGLDIDDDFVYEQVIELLIKAREMKNFLRIDMEDSPFTDKTFNLYKRLRKSFENVGVVVQAKLHRTYADVEALKEYNTNFRLCKGIYIESKSISYQNKQEIRDNYLKILELTFKNGHYVGIATHDDYLVNGAYHLIKEMNIPNDKFEFQMLLGVKENLREKINRDGYKMRVYVPFGKDWYPYSIRRLKENPHMAGDIVKNIFRMGK